MEFEEVELDRCEACLFEVASSAGESFCVFNCRPGFRDVGYS